MLIYGAASSVAVTPYAGVWIEIRRISNIFSGNIVTPYAGVWIEITAVTEAVTEISSLPTRECGLKLKHMYKCIKSISHSLRGSVD